MNFHNRVIFADVDHVVNGRVQIKFRYFEGGWRKLKKHFFLCI